MELILWRHAETEKPVGNLPDHKRRLTAVGEKQAAIMATWLRERLPKTIRIIVAPQVRTRQTADMLDLPYVVERQIGVGATTADLLGAANWPEGSDPVLIVCHQPSIGRLASLFIGGQEADMTIKKSGVVWLSTRERHHRAEVVLRTIMYPDLVKPRSA